MKELSYNRNSAILYAKKWALKRNDAYYDFEKIGGDCTNFISQCIFAGAQIMNYTPDLGWYYRSASDRAAAWTGVRYLYNFLTNNKSVGPYGHTVEKEQLKLGDIIQLGDQSGNFYHSLIVTELSPQILVCAHTFDALDRPLSSYYFESARFIHIAGVHAY